MADYNSIYTGEQIDTAIGKAHEHSNKATLDATTASFTAAEKSKLEGITEGANVNVQPDWNQATTTEDDFIKNKPTIPANISDLNDDSNFVESTDVTNIVKLTQTQYNDLNPKSATTLYLIIEEV